MNRRKGTISVPSSTPKKFLYLFLLFLLNLLTETNYLSDQTQTNFKDGEIFPAAEQFPRQQFIAGSPRQEMFLHRVVAAPPAYRICRT